MPIRSRAGRAAHAPRRRGRSAVAASSSPPPKRMPLSDGDHRLAQPRQRSKTRWPSRTQRRPKSSGVERAPGGDVGAGAERLLALAGQDHDAARASSRSIASAAAASAVEHGRVSALSLAGARQRDGGDGAVDARGGRLSHAPRSSGSTQARSARGGTAPRPSCAGRGATCSGIAACASTSRSRSTPGASSVTVEPVGRQLSSRSAR